MPESPALTNETVVASTKPADCAHWREVALMAILTVFFAGVLVYVSSIHSADPALVTVISTVFSGVAGSLLTKLKQ